MLNSNNLQRRKEHSTIKGIELRLMTGNVVQKWLQQRHHIVFMILAITYSPLHFVVPLMCCVFSFVVCLSGATACVVMSSEVTALDRRIDLCQTEMLLPAVISLHLTPAQYAVCRHTYIKRGCVTHLVVLYSVAYRFNQLRRVIILVLLNLAFLCLPLEILKDVKQARPFLLLLLFL